MFVRLSSILLTALVISGCSIKDIGSSMKASHYFNAKKYGEGVAVFSGKVREDPNNAVDNYYLGRFYLAENKPQRALPYLKKAVSLKPSDTDYQFWLGVSFGAVGNEREEKKRYLKVLRHSPSHSKARLYLAHLQLKGGEYNTALKSYDTILKRYPYNASALYNRGLCLKFTGQEKKEQKAWLKYLEWYPSGFLASKAVNHLNLIGDFSYRNHQFGYRTVTLKNIQFKQGSSDIKFDSRASLRLVGAILSNFAKGDLQITVFHFNSKNLAKERAISLKKFLLQEYPKLKENRIKLSWFGKPEILYGNNKQYRNNKSVRLYMTNWK